MLPLFLFAVSLCMASGQEDWVSPVVSIGQGTVQGLVAEGDYFAFYGIPYADSTSGSHRFKAPSPPPAFEDTFIADRRGVKCVRALEVGYEGTEDCLVVDIFTPEVNETANLPVMVFIKGMELEQQNEPEFSFETLVSRNVVVVRINFRESILGFLCLGTETAPGNAGLKDIIAGLRWIQNNIAQFGGDVNSVTIFGHGSGAAAVDLVTLSPLSEGLVHKAIAQSGSSMSPWSVSRDPTKYAVIVAEALGHIITEKESLSEVFTRTSIAALMAVINELELTDNSLAFAPCIENENLEGDEKFLIKSPYQTIIEGDFQAIPFMIGFVENEGTIRASKAVNDNWLEKMDSSFTDFIQPDLVFDNSEQEINMANDIKTFYFNHNPVTMENIESYLKYHGDTMILVSALREAKLRAAATEAPVYVYEFAYEGQLGDVYSGTFSVVGATHSEELAYLLDLNIDEETISLADATVKDILVERWTNFAKTGNPTRDSLISTWEPVMSENLNVLVIRNGAQNNEGAVQPEVLEVPLVDPHQVETSFWEEVYSEHFLDATGIWSQSERDEDDDDIETVSVDEGSGEGSGEDVEVIEGEPDSASTAVAYTFSIIALFAILNKFHLSQVESF